MLRQESVRYQTSIWNFIHTNCKEMKFVSLQNLERIKNEFLMKAFFPCIMWCNHNNEIKLEIRGKFLWCLVLNIQHTSLLKLDLPGSWSSSASSVLSTSWISHFGGRMEVEEASFNLFFAALSAATDTRRSPRSSSSSNSETILCTSNSYKQSNS